MYFTTASNIFTEKNNYQDFSSIGTFILKYTFIKIHQSDIHWETNKYNFSPENWQ